MKTFYVVYGGSDPNAGVFAFFIVEADAIAWRDSVQPGAAIKEARIDKYDLVNVQIVDF